MKLDPEERIIGETCKRWRELFAIHPAAEKMPRPTAAEFELLKADIAANGLKTPVEFLIVGDRDKARSWLVLDGISRLDALEQLGWTFAFSHGGPLFKPPAGQIPVYSYTSWTEAGCPSPFEHVVSLNIMRLRLNSEQKRNLIAELLKDAPDRSDRDTARLVGVDDKTVGSVRRASEDAGEITGHDRDGRA